MSTNDKTNWERRLAGEVIPIHDGLADYGFYRVRTRDKLSWEPVAYWYDADGTMRCRRGSDDLNEQRAAELWSYASQHPIPHETYTLVINGGAWPDLNEVVTLSNQAPPDDSIEALQEAIDDLAREAARLIRAGAAKTQDEVDQAADVANRLGQLRAKADNVRRAEKQPHLDAERAVDDKWRPIITAADIYARLKDVVCKPFLLRQKAIKDEAEANARRLAAEAAEAARRAEQEARRKAMEAAPNCTQEQADTAQKAEAEARNLAEQAAEAQQRLQTIATSTVTAGSRGRSVGLRSKTVVTIEDRAAVLAYFAHRQEITDALQAMAEKAVKAGVTVPGVKTSKDAQAA